MSRYTTNFRTLIEGGFVTREQIEDIFKSYNLSDYLTSEEIEVIETRGTWTKEKLAKHLGINPVTLYRKIDNSGNFDKKERTL